MKRLDPADERERLERLHGFLQALFQELLFRCGRLQPDGTEIADLPEQCPPWLEPLGGAMTLVDAVLCSERLDAVDVDAARDAVAALADAETATGSVFQPMLARCLARHAASTPLWRAVVHLVRTWDRRSEGNGGET